MILKYVSVSADYLACLIGGTHDPLDVPLPFRGQPNIAFTIDYQEYINFLQSANYTNLKLFTDIETLQECKDYNPRRLYSCYLQDIAFGICKELYYTNMLSGEASIILPLNSNDNSAVLADNLISQMGDTTEYSHVLQARLVDYDYQLNYSANDHNLKLFQLSCAILKYVSECPEIPDNFSILWT